jgi:uncharacterized protein (TIGR02452 family)
MTMRDARAALARETLAVVEAGHYADSRGRRVDLGAAIRACVERTRLWLPDELERLRQARSRAPRNAAAATTFAVANEGTLSAARKLGEAGFAHVGVLNFASARNPGGGFLGGSQAQEESLARSSALHASLTSIAAEPFYAHHRHEKSALYTDRVVVSPHCPVFRDDEGRLLDASHAPTIFTCAAPNAGALSGRDEAALARVPTVFAQRAARFLAVAAETGCDALVLGAWGCGVFRNDPAMVAEVFHHLLAGGGEYAGRFAHVQFAVLDTTPGQACLRSFERKFGGMSPVGAA